MVCQSHYYHLPWGSMEEVYWRTLRPDLLWSSKFFFGCLLHLLNCSLHSRLLHSYFLFQDCFFLFPFIVELGAELCCHFCLDLLTHLLRSCFLRSLLHTLIQPLRQFSRIIIVDGGGACDEKWMQSMLLHHEPLRTESIHATLIV